MSDTTQTSPVFKIDGEPLRLSCGLTEHQSIWRITGKNLLAGENPAQGGITPNNIAQLLHTMAQRNHPTLTVEKIAAGMSSTKEIVLAYNAIVHVINDGLGEAVDAEKNPSVAA